MDSSVWTHPYGFNHIDHMDAGSSSADRRHQKSEQLGEFGGRLGKLLATALRGDYRQRFFVQ
jgi:hypothetical protein